MFNYPVIVHIRQRGNPMPRLNRDGYTKRDGSPTCQEVLLQGEKKYRRVYVWQFSNCGTCFIKVNGKPVIVHV